MNVNYVTRTVRQIPQQIPILVNRKLDIFSSTIYSFPLLKFFRVKEKKTFKLLLKYLYKSFFFLL